MLNIKKERERERRRRIRNIQSSLIKFLNKI